MRVLSPTSVAYAVSALADNPGATVLAGGTDVMVEVNAGRWTPTHVISVGRIAELRGAAYEAETHSIRVAAATTLTELMGSPVAGRVPALVAALRSVGSPQIRNAATLGGSLGTSSPTGDALPVLVALGASVELVSTRGQRLVPVEQFLVGAKRTTRAPDELITAVHVPVLDGRQHFARVGPRNGMAIAICNAAIVVARAQRSVRLAMGGVGPTVMRARAAEAWLADDIDWATLRLSDPMTTMVTSARFGELAAAACRPIDDHRSTGAYRRHAIGIIASRLSRRALA
jgi:CO/xanthine dehydrogenase FAD-binding subunit